MRKVPVQTNPSNNKNEDEEVKKDSNPLELTEEVEAEELTEEVKVEKK